MAERTRVCRVRKMPASHQHIGRNHKVMTTPHLDERGIVTDTQHRVPRAVRKITPDQFKFGSGHVTYYGRWTGSLPCRSFPALSASHLFLSEYGR